MNTRRRFSVLLALFTAFAMMAATAAVGPAEAQNSPTEVLLVTGSSTGTNDDNTIAGVLADAGYSVTIVDDNTVSAASAVGIDVVLVTASASSSAVGTAFAAAAVPLVSYEFLLYDDLGLTGNGTSNRREQGTFRAIDIVDSGHPIVAGMYSGRTDVFTSFTKVTWGIPSPAATIVASRLSVPEHAVIFTYETGAILASGQPAPARRAGTFLAQASDGRLNTVGEELLLGTVAWAAGAPSNDGNQPPEVDAGTDIVVDSAGAVTVAVSGSVTDDGGSGQAVTTNWSGPPGTLFATPTALQSDVDLPGPGTYDLTLSADDGLLSASDILTVTVTDPNAPPRILMVTGSSAGSADDQAVRAALMAAGFDVTVRDDDLADPADAVDQDLVLITATAAAIKVGTTFTEVAVPVVNYEYLLHDDLALTANGSSNRGEAGSHQGIDIVDSAHPIVANAFSGPTNVFVASSRVNWGIPAPSAQIVATQIGRPERAALYTYETGDIMIGGQVAPARRAGIFLSAASDGRLNGAGETLLVNTAFWAAGQPVQPINVPPVVDVGSDMQFISGGPISVDVTGIVTDDGLPGQSVALNWSGTGGVSFDNPALAATTANLPGPGSYLLTLSADDGALNGSDSLSVTVEDPNGPPSVLMVTTSATGSADDQAVAQELESAGFQISIVDDAAAAALDLSSYDAVLISTTASPAVLGSTFTDAAIGLVNYEYLLHDDLGLTGSGSANRGEKGTYRAIDIADSTHPIIGGDFSGEVDVFTTFTKVTWGVPAASADVIATALRSPAKSILFSYEQGVPLANGQSAPHRRVGIFPAMASDGALNPSGYALLARALGWVAADANGAPTVEAGPDDIVDRTAQITLGGSFSDDILPIGPARVVTWSGPPEVTFNDPATLTPTITFSAAGTYQLTLEVDDGLAIGSDTMTITATDQLPPMASGTLDLTTGQAPLAIVADGTTSSDPDGTIVIYSWDFGDGATANTATAGHIYNSVGSFPVNLTVTDDLGATNTALIGTVVVSSGTGNSGPATFVPISIANGDLPAPPPGSNTDQTGLQIADLDGDGDTDIIVSGRNGPNSVQWYRRSAGGIWDLYIVESDTMDVEAGATVGDVDGDGDPDLIIPGDRDSNRIWWWENPGTGYSPSTDWVRREIISSGPVKHHDVRFGDVDHDGQPELVYWTQGLPISRVDDLFVAEVPADPKTAGEWSSTLIYDASVASEGLDIADVDLDGHPDLIAAGRLFTYNPGSGTFSSVQLTSTAFGRYKVADVVDGGRPEILVSSGDQIGPLDLLEWNGSSWTSTSLLGGASGIAAPWNRGHSLDVGDVNGDGDLDVFSAEMYLVGGSDSAQGNARSVIWYGDGSGGFQTDVLTVGEDNHESILADVDADGDLDVVSKPFNLNIPSLTVFINQGSTPPVSNLNQWQKRVIDTKPARSMFIFNADIDEDGDDDLVTGAWWFENPGSITGTWTRHTIGSPLGDAMVVSDLDGDGNLDVFGARGPAGTSPLPRRLAWAKGDGTGNFTTYTNIDSGVSSFLQGAAAVSFSPTGPVEVWLSWNHRNNNIQKLVVPANPTTQQWVLQTASTISQGEEIEFGDIDADGDLDLMEGHIWLENQGGTFVDHVLHTPTNCCFPGVIDTLPLPDRVVLGDINQDGRLDVVVSHEYDPLQRLVWYEQPSGDPTGEWAEHLIFSAAFPIHSLDVRDMDNDGDLDVVAGEHVQAPDIITDGRAWVFENIGQGASWATHLVDDTDAHHDGTQVADLDQDGDLDIFSIGWEHNRVLIYENSSSGS